MNLRTFTALLIGAFIYSSSIAQIEISEYSASNLNSFVDSFLKTEDWIEIHNAGTDAVDISGYGISDKESKPLKWRVPDGVVLGAGEYMHVWCSGRDLLAAGIYHTNFKLTQTKGDEYIVLSDPSGNIIESTLYELTLTEHSRVKVNGEWLVSVDPSPGSGLQQGVYDGYTNTPTISLGAGFFTEVQTATVEINDTNVTTYYTLDGNEPTEDSEVYVPGSVITISETSILKAKNFSSDPAILPGKIDYASYFINDEFTLPVFSIAADQVQDLANGQGEVIPIGTIEYFDAENNLTGHSYGSLNRHGQDSWILDHRSIDWVSRDEMGYNKAVDAKLFTYSDRTDYQRFMMRASGDDNYPANDDNNHVGSCHIRDEYVHELAQKGGMKMDLRAVERVVVFLNGDYWGVYGLRERPVDHDYTKEFYDQDKYHMHYLLTWGNTWAEYGGDEAFAEWEQFRDFILENDMSIPENYEIVKDNLQVVSLIDYMVTNLNVVSQDWLNYNTGWWKGTNPDGKHKKWGYVLWDNDATFDYYINYTGVPNTDPDALPCDIDVIANSMDSFFGGGGGGGGSVGNLHSGDIIDSPGDCATIMNGSSPYDSSDPIYNQVVNFDNYCCCQDWNGDCQDKYDEIAAEGTTLPSDYDDCGSIMNGSSPYSSSDENFQIVINQYPECCTEWGSLCESIYTLAELDFFAGECNDSVDGGGSGGGGSFVVTPNNDVGKHEKIYLKLQAENEEFRQLYYSRQADLMNTVFSCENMLSTLDSMLNTIRPEMPRQIARWGGSMSEWEANVDRLIGFVEQRCEFLPGGMNDCYDLEGPYPLTVDVRPIGVGEIELNTLDLTSFPWTGNYYGNMDNLLEAKAYDDSEWKFSHWEVNGGSPVSPDINQAKASIQISNTESITAVFTDDFSNTQDLDKIVSLQAYPSPVQDVLTIEYTLEEAADVKIEIYSSLGQKVVEYPMVKNQAASIYSHKVDINAANMKPGLYNVSLTSGSASITRKVTVIN